LPPLRLKELDVPRMLVEIVPVAVLEVEELVLLVDDDVDEVVEVEDEEEVDDVGEGHRREKIVK
jgi:hypothetical protein